MINSDLLNPFFSEVYHEEFGLPDQEFRNSQKVLDVEQAIKSLRFEIAILNFDNFELPNNVEERRASEYFRSCIKRRLIRALVILKTLQNEWMSQKEIVETFNWSKGFVSQVCKDAFEAKWFKKVIRPHKNMPCVPLYQATDIIQKSVINYSEYLYNESRKL